jgi:TrmH family RNA methyltransferase
LQNGFLFICMLTNSDRKFIQSLKSQHGRKKNRAFLVEGPKLLEELLSSNFEIKYLLTTKDFISNKLSNKQKPIVVSQTELDKFSLFSKANNVVAVVPYPKAQNIDFKSGSYILTLDTIQDPGNLGTIIRTADWFGINNIICSTDTVDCYNPKVVQASMGSIFRVNIQYLDLVELFSEYKNKIPIYGTLLKGTPLKETKFSQKGFLVIGNESKGISKSVQEFIDHSIHIPKSKNSKTESLNASVACGILLNYIHNQ